MEPRVILNGAKYVAFSAGVDQASRAIYRAGVANNQTIKGAIDKDKELYKSGIGTSVYSDLTIPAFSYTDPVSGVTYDVPEIQMYSMRISVNMNKNIVKTPIVGLQGGTVKEYCSDGDDSVIIEGEITGQNGVYPALEVNELKKLCRAPVAFNVVSTFLQNLDIDTLVIEYADIPQKAGGYSFQDFKLYCISDIPIELNLISSSNTNA